MRFHCILSSGIAWFISTKTTSHTSNFEWYPWTAQPASSKSMQFSCKREFSHGFIWKHRMDLVNFRAWKFEFRFGNFAIIILQAKSNANTHISNSKKYIFLIGVWILLKRIDVSQSNFYFFGVDIAIESSIGIGIFIGRRICIQILYYLITNNKSHMKCTAGPRHN